MLELSFITSHNLAVDDLVVKLTETAKLPHLIWTTTKATFAYLKTSLRISNAIMYTYIYNFLQIYTGAWSTTIYQIPTDQQHQPSVCTAVGLSEKRGTRCHRHIIRGVAPRGRQSRRTKAPPGRACPAPPARALSGGPALALLHHHRRVAAAPVVSSSTNFTAPTECSSMPFTATGSTMPTPLLLQRRDVSQPARPLWYA